MSALEVVTSRAHDATSHSTDGRADARDNAAQCCASCSTTECRSGSTAHSAGLVCRVSPTGRRSLEISRNRIECVAVVIDLLLVVAVVLLIPVVVLLVDIALLVVLLDLTEAR